MRRTAVLFAIVLGIAGTQLPFPRPATVFAQGSYIQTENAKPGTLDWTLTNPGYASGAIEGYASVASVNRGGQIKFFVNTPDPTYTLDIFRMGYYGGLGGRRMMATVTRTGTRQVIPTPDPLSGLIECDWVDPFVLNIPASTDPTEWMSGIYLVKLTAGTSRKQQYIVFAVRDDARFSDLIMVQTVSTYQAYNPWGGKSLYGTIAVRDDTANAAYKVSWDRPYFGEEYNGASQFFQREYGMLKWLEREGYDVSYATNIELDGDPTLLHNHKAYLSVGHDEYWSKNMRDAVERARDMGIHLGFFSANTCYWQVRFEPSVTHGVPGRVMVGYKSNWASDPITPDYLKTGRWRDAPVNRSEDSMMGVMYITQAKPAMIIEDASHWAFTGTGLKNGDRVVNPDGQPFMGYEIDAMGPMSPANVQRLAHSPATPNRANYADTTVYLAPSGATVFSTGSIDWSQTAPAIQQLTRNVLARFTRGAFSETIPVRPALPAPFVSADIGNVGRAGFVSMAGADSFTLEGAGQTTFSGGDALYYAHQPLAGDGSITVRLTSLQLYWGNRAGVMIRESLAPTAKSVAVLGRPSGSRGVLLEGVEFAVKDVAGTKARSVASRDLAMPNWLRLERSGDVFSSYTSPDGTNWTPLSTVTVPMNRDVLIGASVAGTRTGVWTTATFDNVAVIAARGEPAPPPDACTAVTLSRTFFYSGAPESNWTVGVTPVAPSSSCRWTVTKDQPWLVLNTDPNLASVSGSGPGSFRLRTLANTGPKRTGHFTIAGVTYLVTQEAAPTAPPPPPPTPTPTPIPACTAVTLSRAFFYSGPAESNWTVTVTPTAPAETCTWTVTKDQPWLVLNTDPALTSVSGTGPGSFRLRVLQNPNPDIKRVGQFTIAGTTYTVTQYK